MAESPTPPGPSGQHVHSDELDRIEEEIEEAIEKEEHLHPKKEPTYFDIDEPKEK
jgi:hypothetical protein